MRSLMALGAVMAVAAAADPAHAAAQEPTRPLLQLEVGDSVGLPLPTAKLEWFTYVQGGIWKEWVPIEPGDLEPGMHLLRFSHDGYRPSIISVPLQKGARVSLRVRLSPDSAAPDARRPVEAADVRAIGLVLADGGVARDFLGTRRVIDRATIEQVDQPRISDILRRTSRSGVLVLPASGGQYVVRIGGRGLCGSGVMVDGKPNLITFSAYEQFYGASEAEVIEIVENANAIPFAFRRSNLRDCAMLLVWLRRR